MIPKIKFPVRYQKIWRKCQSLLKAGRPGDLEHAQDTAQLIINYQGQLKFDKDVIIPVAMMHDIGHGAILPGHFKFITGPEKIANGKLVHMLAGAKIAQDILKSVNYNPQKIKEIVDIISMHDADQIQGVNLKKVYNTSNKKIFHDIDSLDRYTELRVKNFEKMYPNRQELLKVLTEFLDLFFYSEFKNLAKKRLQGLLKYETQED